MKHHEPQWATEAGCLGKQLFTDLVIARDVAKRSSRARDAAIQPYRCAGCDGWHVGSDNGKRRKMKQVGRR